MHQYHVVECWPDSNRVGLQCQLGSYHLVRVLSAMPAADISLNGDKPHLGFGILSCTLSGRTFRVIFEWINQIHLCAAPSWMSAVVPASQASRYTAWTGAD